MHEQAHKAAMGAENLQELVGLFEAAKTIANIDIAHASLALYCK